MNENAAFPRQSMFKFRPRESDVSSSAIRAQDSIFKTPSLYRIYTLSFQDLQQRYYQIRTQKVARCSFPYAVQKLSFFFKTFVARKRLFFEKESQASLVTRRQHVWM
ncbi:hypothetical protein KP509_05G096900 [Ceratopteris richardii]|uniref:Uncharacterized protein n=1 Tax=Ceratopteris richardii TaxID=49495 RepID=A0A8T2UVN8_CERRI|nr:hypothetical protein KP509_05G096900 [Ceratopteris richardii]